MITRLKTIKKTSLLLTKAY